MYLELASLFENPGMSVPFGYRLPARYDELPFVCAPEISGQVKNRTGVVTLEGRAKVELCAACDRCAAGFDYHDEVPLLHTLVLSLNDEDNSDFILLESSRFCPDDLVWDDIVLSLPTKMLCRPDCAGLCTCGQNLNEGACACKPEGDPRLAKLKQLLDSPAI